MTSHDTISGTHRFETTLPPRIRFWRGFSDGVSFSARLVRKCCTSTVLATPLRVDNERGSSMSKVSMMGTITCKEGMVDELEVLMREMVEAAKQEPGVEIYSYHRGEGDTFSFFALMADEVAMQSHGQSVAMQAAMGKVGDVVAEPPKMSMTTPVAAIGFDV